MSMYVCSNDLAVVFGTPSMPVGGWKQTPSCLPSLVVMLLLALSVAQQQATAITLTLSES